MDPNEAAIRIVELTTRAGAPEHDRFPQLEFRSGAAFAHAPWAASCTVKPARQRDRWVQAYGPTPDRALERLLYAVAEAVLP